MCCGIHRLTNGSVCRSVQRALSPKGSSELPPGISKGTVAAVEPGHQGQQWEQGSAGLAQGGLCSAPHARLCCAGPGSGDTAWAQRIAASSLGAVCSLDTAAGQGGLGLVAEGQ